MALSGDEVDRQIEQMAKFIVEEARDKAKEINIKADDDFQRELAKTVQEERQKLLATQEKRKKAFETKKQMYDSVMVLKDC
jgi:V-type H+-transporting ATPase subunit E